MGLYTAGNEMEGTQDAYVGGEKAVNECGNGINTHNSAQGVSVLLIMPRNKMVVAPITG